MNVSKSIMSTDKNGHHLSIGQAYEGSIDEVHYYIGLYDYDFGEMISACINPKRFNDNTSFYFEAYDLLKDFERDYVFLKKEMIYLLEHYSTINIYD